MSLSLYRSYFSSHVLRSIIKNSSLFRFSSNTSSRNTFSERKRIFKQVNIAESSANDNRLSYEILLDKKKLKTPSGTIMNIENELLALAVAQEWNQQKTTIDLPSMHLTSLVNTIIDNPNKVTKSKLIEQIMFFLEWDTVLHRSENPEELKQLESNAWNPILQYINEQYGTQFSPTYHLDIKQVVSDHDRQVIEKYLNQLDEQSLLTFMYMSELSKSILLSICLLRRFRTIDETVTLSRLETEYQITHWSNVPYYHDYELMDLRSKLSAAYLVFYCLNNNITRKVVGKIKS